MTKRLTKEQIDAALKLHEGGLNWAIIASYLGVDVATLRKHRKKHYEKNKH